MFRRRRFGKQAHLWPPLRPWARPQLEAAAQQALVRAHRLMEVGDFLNAAELYEQLARPHHDLGRPRQAANLYLQAGRARLLGGHIPAGVALIRQGMGIFAQIGAWERFEQVGLRAVNELRQLGQAQMAQELRAWMDGLHPQAAPIPETAHHPRLPLKCPFCGATVRPDEIEWIQDPNGEPLAECAYCGSAISGE